MRHQTKRRLQEIIPLHDKGPSKRNNEKTQLQAKYFKTKTQKDYASFKKQMHFCSNFYIRERTKYYENLTWKLLLIALNFEKLLYTFSEIKLKGLGESFKKWQDLFWRS